MTLGDLLRKQPAGVFGTGAELSAVSRCDEGELHGAPALAQDCSRGSGSGSSLDATGSGVDVPSEAGGVCSTSE